VALLEVFGLDNRGRVIGTLVTKGGVHHSDRGVPRGLKARFQIARALARLVIMGRRAVVKSRTQGSWGARLGDPSPQPRASQRPREAASV